MIMNNSREEDGGLQAKEEEQKNEGRITSRTLPVSTSRQWSSFRNPRIVRVSRSFGGKDRHSKVCTVRGLRDRRIRLSVPTAIQLYDLQEKLGLSQPSKVVDWLLDATKQDIDNLPPLQMPPGFGQFHQQMFGASGSRNLIGDLLLPYESNTYQSSISPFFPTNTSSFLGKYGLRISDNVVDGHDNNGDGKFWDTESGSRSKNKEVIQKDQALDHHDQKGKSIELQKLSAQSFFPIVGYSSLPAATLPTNVMPYSSYNHWPENSNLSLSQFGSHGFQPQAETFFNPNSMQLPSSSLALPSGSHLYFCPTTVPSPFPSYPSYLTPSNETDTRQMNHFQLLNNAAGPSQQFLPSSFMPGLHLINPSSRSFQANVNSKYPHDNDQSQPDKGVDNS